MTQYLSFYHYFNGEPENPFDNIKQNAAHMFWWYESIYEERFNNGNFSFAEWKHITGYGISEDELKAVLNTKPVSKEELFKLWLYHLLSEYLPDKWSGCNTDYYHNLYWGIIGRADYLDHLTPI